MTPHEWRFVPPTVAHALGEARLQHHYAAHAISALGDAVLPRRSDDSQQSLRYDPVLHALCGETTASGHAAALLFDGFAIALLDRERIRIAQCPLDGITLDAAREWLRSAFDAATGSHAVLALPRHDDFPDHPLAHGAPFRRSTEGPHVGALFANAASVFAPRARDVVVRVWPHHFDIAFNLAGLRDGQSIGIGLSLGDASIGEPYWYVSVWPHPTASRALPPLARGVWHREGWTGAVLRWSQIVAHDAADQREFAERFLDGAIVATQRVLAET